MNKKQIRIPDFEDMATDLAVGVAYDLTVGILFGAGFEHVKGGAVKELFQTVLKKHNIYDKFMKNVTDKLKLRSNGNNDT